jgi:hypothetical protein
MNRRALLIALLLLAGLLVYAWFALKGDARELEERWQEGERVFAVPRETVESLEVRGRGLVARYRRGTEGWEMAEGGGADRPEQAPEVLYSWSLLRFLVYVDEDPANLASFGLDPPRYRVEATTRDGGRHTLSLGSDSTLATALGTYVLVDDRPEVLLLEAGAWSLAEELDLALGLDPEQGG